MAPKKKRARSVKDKDVQFMKILKAGEELLRDGCGTFSLRELARRLEMAPSNLYNYVRNENELRLAIIHAHFTMSSEGITQLTEMRGKSYLEMMEAMIQHFYESNREHRWVATELMRLQNRGGGHSLDIGLMIKPFKDLIEKAVGAGELSEQDAEFSAFNVWSLLQGSVNMLRLAESSKMFDDAREKEHMEFITRLIISSLDMM